MWRHRKRDAVYTSPREPAPDGVTRIWVDTRRVVQNIASRDRAPAIMVRRGRGRIQYVHGVEVHGPCRVKQALQGDDDSPQIYIETDGTVSTI